MARPLLQAPDADGNGVPVLIQHCLLNPTSPLPFLMQAPGTRLDRHKRTR
jgi:hypothetical protein